MMSESHSGSMHFVMMPLATVVQPSSSDGTTRKVLRGGGTVLLETVLDIGGLGLTCWLVNVTTNSASVTFIFKATFFNMAGWSEQKKIYRQTIPTT